MRFRSLLGLVMVLSISQALGACTSPRPPDPAPPATESSSQDAAIGERDVAPPPAQDDAGQPATSSGVVLGTDACERDTDCVPARCCHPAECVARAKAPACQDVMCTMECRLQTLDCGGGCLCSDGRCGAKLNTLGPPERAL